MVAFDVDTNASDKHLTDEGCENTTGRFHQQATTNFGSNNQERKSDEQQTSLQYV